MPELKTNPDKPQGQVKAKASHPIAPRAIGTALLMLIIVIIDQFIKFEVKTHFSLYESLDVTSWFQILFTENRGMAFGMQFAGTMVLALFRVVAIGFFFVALVKLIRRSAPLGLIICLAMIIAGSVGNIIDNMFNGLIYTESLPYGEPSHLVAFGEGYGSFLSGRVIDMFYFPLFTWPNWMPFVGGHIFFGAIFNFADASISCGAVAMAIFYGKYLTKSGNLFKNSHAS